MEKQLIQEAIRRCGHDDRGEQDYEVLRNQLLGILACPEQHPPGPIVQTSGLFDYALKCHGELDKALVSILPHLPGAIFSHLDYCLDAGRLRFNATVEPSRQEAVLLSLYTDLCWLAKAVGGFTVTLFMRNTVLPDVSVPEGVVYGVRENAVYVCGQRAFVPKTTPESEAELLQQLEQLLLSWQPGYPSRAQAAAWFGWSERTFKRRLQDRGQTWKGVLERVRQRESCRLLRQNIPISTIALSQGYRDQANFSRAFTRWQGVSPRQYRADRARK